MKAVLMDDYNRKLAIISYLLPTLQEIRLTFLQKQQEAIPAHNQDASQELVEYVNYNLTSNELSLDTLSEHFLISKCQLNRIFKQATGSTIWDYVLIKRMMAARQMLRAGKPALEVCQTCGFRDYSAFYRLYKKRFHVTPQEDSGRMPGS
jgi:AraC-like DNA-binding protein